MMSKETTAKIARLAARFLSGELKSLTRKQQLSLAASALVQAEAEQESVKAWGFETMATGELSRFAAGAKATARYWSGSGERIVPVLITRADKRLTKRKRGRK